MIFAAIWTSVVGGFDAFMGVNMYRQTQAKGFPMVQGSILTSEVESSSSRDGTTYRAEVSFQYEVDGISHTSDTYRFGAMGTSSESAANSVVEQYPSGKVVDVHYNPNKQTFGRKTDVILPVEAVIQVETRTHVHQGSKGGVSYSYAPTLLWLTDESDCKKEKLIEWSDENRAQAFTQWLQERLGLVNDFSGSA